MDKRVAPTVAYAPTRGLRFPTTPSIGERISVQPRWRRAQIAIRCGLVESCLGLLHLRVDYFKLSLRRIKCRSHLEISGTRFFISPSACSNAATRSRRFNPQRWIGDLVETVRTGGCCIHLMSSDNPKMTFS
jgi:hypothetical protein